MNRKEIIVFSVFVNIGLLVGLFIFALKPTLKGEMNIETNDVVITSKKDSKKNVKDSELDEVNQILKEYTVKTDHKNQKNQVEIKKGNELEQKKYGSDSLNKKIENNQLNIASKHPSLDKNSSAIEVIVRQGDVLEKIALRHHTTIEEIMKNNHMKDTRLRIGQILYVKENTLAGKQFVKSIKKQPNVASAEKKYYVVKNGDSPWTIAIKNHIKVNDLLRLNGLNEAKAKKIKPGHKLRIK